MIKTIGKLCHLQGTETRYLSHYYYTAWPDFGVPKSPESLLKFIEKVRSELNPQLGPTIVHCRFLTFDIMRNIKVKTKW